MPDYIPIDDKVAKAIGRPHRTILNLIRNGNLKGKMFSARDWRIDTSELPSSFFADNPQTQAQDTHTEVIIAKATPELIATKTPSQVSTPLQDTLDNIKLTEAKIKEAKFKIELQEIEKQRDLPETIKKRDQLSQERDTLSQQRENAVTQRESVVGQREQAIRLAEVELNNKVNGAETHVKIRTTEANKIIADANTYDKAKRIEAVDYYTAKVEAAKELDAEILDKQAELDNLNTEITEQVQFLIKRTKQWSGFAEKESTRSYRIAERTGGANGQYHTARSNNLWTLKGMLDKIVKSLGG